MIKEQHLLIKEQHLVRAILLPRLLLKLKINDDLIKEKKSKGIEDNLAFDGSTWKEEQKGWTRW